MNKNKKAMVLSALASLAILSGCSSVETIESDGETYIKNGEEYIKVENKTQIFEIGTHYIQYYNYCENDKYEEAPFGHADGFLDSNIPVIEGYTVVDIEPVIEKYGYGSKTTGFVYIFVNTERVEVTSTYDYNTNTYNYSNPGTIIEEKKLS